MPFIQFYDDRGRAYSITSSDPDVIKGWLYEQATRLAPSLNGINARLMIQPLMDADGSTDWQPGARVNYDLSREKLAALAAWLEDSQHSPAVPPAPPEYAGGTTGFPEVTP